MGDYVPEVDGLHSCYRIGLNVPLIVLGPHVLRTDLLCTALWCEDVGRAAGRFERPNAGVERGSWG